MLVLVGCTDMNMNVMNLIWTYESYGFFNLKAELEKNLNDFGVACLQATPKKNLFRNTTVFNRLRVFSVKPIRPTG